MREFSKIIIYDNEGQQTDSEYRYLASLDFKHMGISYLRSGWEEAKAVTLSEEDFDDLAVYLFEVLNGVLKEQANYRCEFRDRSSYMEWCRKSPFAERDVSRSVLCELKYGRRVLFLCTNGGPVPAELDELEKMLQGFLQID